MNADSGHAREIFARLAQTFASRRDADPASSYVAKLFSKAPDAALKKVGEEATEFVMACKDCELESSADDRARVVAELARREGLSGIDEKASRPK